MPNPPGAPGRSAALPMKEWRPGTHIARTHSFVNYVVALNSNANYLTHTKRRKKKVD